MVVGNRWSTRGRRESVSASLGACVRELKTGAWRDLPAAEGLPPNAVDTVALDGTSLWVGGMGFIACVDLTRDQVRALAYLPEPAIHRLHVGGGYVWIQCENRLYRVSLQGIP